jgi:hypothetical protein
MKKQQVAVVLGALSFVYLFVPEPTDVVPFIGWLDEGLAAAVLMWALRTLRVSPKELARVPTGILAARSR